MGISTDGRPDAVEFANGANDSQESGATSRVFHYLRRSGGRWLLSLFVSASFAAAAPGATISPETCKPEEWPRFSFYRSVNTQIKVQHGPSVVFMGDSITQGWGERAYIKDNPAFVGRGIGGQTAAQMLARFHADVITLKPAIVHIMAGTNDVAENAGHETDEEIEGCIISMIELAEANGIKVVLASIPPAADFPWRRGLNPKDRIKRLNDWSRGYAAQSGLIYADYWSVLAAPDGSMKSEFTTDGVHLSENGYLAIQPLADTAIKSAFTQSFAKTSVHQPPT